MLREIHHCVIPTFSGQKLPLLTHGQDFFSQEGFNRSSGKTAQKNATFWCPTNPHKPMFFVIFETRELDNLDFLKPWVIQELMVFFFWYIFGL